MGSSFLIRHNNFKILFVRTSNVFELVSMYIKIYVIDLYLYVVYICIHYILQNMDLTIAEISIVHCIM